VQDDKSTPQTTVRVRYCLFSRPLVSLWWAVGPLALSAACHGGMPGEATIGGAAAIAIIWALGKAEERERAGR
jgi:hypothetical protein